MEHFQNYNWQKKHNCKQKFTFLIDDSTITDSQQIANEFNTVFCFNRSQIICGNCIYCQSIIICKSI